jgi:hypothetical protein
VPAHNIDTHLFRAAEYPDPGDADTITVDRNPCVVGLVSAAAETRPLARPTRSGGTVFLYMKTDGGDITLTVTGGFNEDGETTFTFSDPGQFIFLQAAYESSGGTYYWRKLSDHAVGNISAAVLAVLDAVSSTAAELNYLDQDLATNTLTRGAGVDTAESYSGSIERHGGLAVTRIVVDISTLIGSATDLDIIGESAAASCHFGQITTAKSGTIIGGKVTCLEVPAGGADDIDFYSSTVSTGTQDVIITDAALGTETALVTSGGAWTSGATKGMTALPTANDYIYIINGAASGGTFTAGKFLIELYGTF